MGVRLILLIGLLTGVLYCVHLLAQDYQAIFGASKLSKLLIKRDISRKITKPNVRWKKIIQSDPIQCARYLYCELGTRVPDNDLKKGLIYMLTLEPRIEDERAWNEFSKAYSLGIMYKDAASCKKQYALCPFNSSFLFEIIQLLLPMRTKQPS